MVNGDCKILCPQGHGILLSAGPQRHVPGRLKQEFKRLRNTHPIIFRKAKVDSLIWPVCEAKDAPAVRAFAIIKTSE